jgi:hypothetical protein
MTRLQVCKLSHLLCRPRPHRDRHQQRRRRHSHPHRSRRSQVSGRVLQAVRHECNHGIVIRLRCSLRVRVSSDGHGPGGLHSRSLCQDWLAA